MAARYRPDIDGLRAVAVTAVVLFHAGAGVPGGFAGVDVFFVISGYLITGILFGELAETGAISLAGFYARRFARILPSLVLVTCATVAAGTLLMSSTLWGINGVAKSAVAALLFVANFYFYVTTSDYFATASSQLPLLHTWSLGVEEQYYMVWPLLLLAASRLGFGSLRQRCLAVIGLITVLSGGYCAAINSHSPSLAFFSPLSRFWELGIGSALVLAEPMLVRSRWPQAMGLAGIVLIAAAIVLTREGPAFPWPMGLLAVAGTALVIHANGLAPKSLASRVLSTRPFVMVGKISYAWYLWHWPLLAYADVVNVGPPPAAQRVVLVLASFAAAWLTVRFYEDPLRRRARILSRWRVIAVGGAAIAATVVSTGMVFAAAHIGLVPQDPRLAAAFADRSPRERECLFDALGPQLTAPCLAPAGRARVILWGDSHADQWAPALDAWSRNSPGWAVEQLTRAACPPVVGVLPRKLDGGSYVHCVEFNRAAVKRILDTREPKVVVIAGNWALRLGFRFDERSKTAPPFIDVRAASSADAQHALEQALDQTLGTFSRANVPVVLVLQSPVFERLPATCVIQLGPARCVLTPEQVATQIRLANAILTKAASRFPNVQVLDPAAILCSQQGCPATLGGRIAYYDSDHVAASTATSPASLALWSRSIDQARAAPGEKSGI